MEKCMIDVCSPDRLTAMTLVNWPLVAYPVARLTTLDDLRIDVAAAVAGPLAQRHCRVAEALAPYLGRPDLLSASACQCSPDRYLRHLLHAAHDYTILALVWRPRQMSPVHGHRTWCAFGLHQGWMVESFYHPETKGGEAQAGEPQGCAPRRAGDISHSAAEPNAAHRLANLGTKTAISIHVYGAPYDRLGAEVNQIWSD
jgi:predicted metal-dependent enzyme (double-stranded beta helix superfamily)